MDNYESPACRFRGSNAMKPGINVIPSTHDIFMREVKDARLIFVDNPGDGFRPYKSHLWPENIKVYRHPNNKLKILCETADAFNYWITKSETSSLIFNIFKYPSVFFESLISSTESPVNNHED